MFRGPKSSASKSAASKSVPVGRQEMAVWLGRALSSDEVVLQAMLQLVHIIGVQQQALQALVRQQTGQPLEPDQQKALEAAGGAAGQDIFQRLQELETDLQPVLKAVGQACATLQKDL